MSDNKGNIVLYTTDDGDEELEEKVVSAFFAHTTQHGAIEGKTQRSTTMKTQSLIAVAVGMAVTVSLTLLSCGGKDKDGKGIGLRRDKQVAGQARNDGVFETVAIGGKMWMKKNLNVETENSWCYDFDPANCEIYGRLYNWYAAKSACAALGDGWRLPNDKDWNAFVNAAGGKSKAGTALKSKTGWLSHSKTPSGNDRFGFNALPGGFNISSDFVSAGYRGFWWSATGNGAATARFRRMGYDYENVDTDYNYKDHGFSVRCVKD